MADLLRTLSANTGLATSDVIRIIATAPRRYKTYFIPKRSGGLREIAQPARELKALQYVLMEVVLTKLPIHASATAYRSGMSITDNARVHAGDTPILKIDFRDFFPSIHEIDWRRYCIKNAILDGEDIGISSQLLFRKAKKEKTLKLSIGAPSSPLLSNILLYEFDEYVAKESNKRRILYTRYADDITFSGQRMGLLKDMLKVVQNSVKETLCPALKINPEKTNFVSAKYRRNVTGLVLGNSGEIGIGREKLRLLRARVFRALQGDLSADELRSLGGYLSFVRGADRSSYEKILVKYGEAAVSRITFGSTSVGEK